MKRDDIIRWAREAGWTDYSLTVPFQRKQLERFAFFVAAAAKAEEREAWANDTTLKLIADWKYMVGIAERGFGTPLPEGMAGTEYLLSYVKELEAQANLVAAAAKAEEREKYSPIGTVAGGGGERTFMHPSVKYILPIGLQLYARIEVREEDKV